MVLDGVGEVDAVVEVVVVGVVDGVSEVDGVGRVG